MVERHRRTAARTTRTAQSGRVYKETGYGLVGIAGESRSGDANGQYIRVLGGGGINTVARVATDSGAGPAGRRRSPVQQLLELGCRRINASAKTAVRARRSRARRRSRRTCDAGLGGAPAPEQAPAAAAPCRPEFAATIDEFEQLVDRARQDAGRRSSDESGDRAAARQRRRDRGAAKFLEDYRDRGTDALLGRGDG